MKLKTPSFILLLASAALLFSTMPLGAAESVEMSIQRTLKLESAALDVAISKDGSRIFVLTEQGEILVYSPKGDVQGRIDVGGDVDQISIAPGGDAILLNSRKNKTVQVVALDFINEIDITGAPIKGREDAPVVVAVFSDFQ